MSKLVVLSFEFTRVSVGIKDTNSVSAVEALTSIIAIKESVYVHLFVVFLLSTIIQACLNFLNRMVLCNVHSVSCQIIYLK
jgi:hypothetical protein